MPRRVVMTHDLGDTTPATDASSPAAAAVGRLPAGEEAQLERQQPQRVLRGKDAALARAPGAPPRGRAAAPACAPPGAAGPPGFGTAAVRLVAARKGSTWGQVK